MMPPSRVALGSRELELRFTPRATAQLDAELEPLDIELELYFSCLIRKRVYVRREPRADVTARGRVNEHVTVSFRPVMTKACAVHDVAGAPDLEPIPLVRPGAFTPKWLHLDFRHGDWVGEFGY
jgi:hypothetical protein